MEIVETTLPGVGFDALIRSHRDGDLVVVTVGAMVFVQWSVDDLPTRDLFLVTGHQQGCGIRRRSPWFLGKDTVSLMPG